MDLPKACTVYLRYMIYSTYSSLVKAVHHFMRIFVNLSKRNTDTNTFMPRQANGPKEVMFLNNKLRKVDGVPHCYGKRVFVAAGTVTQLSWSQKLDVIPFFMNDKVKKRSLQLRCLKWDSYGIRTTLRRHFYRYVHAASGSYLAFRRSSYHTCDNIFFTFFHICWVNVIMMAIPCAHSNPGYDRATSRILHIHSPSESTANAEEHCACSVSVGNPYVMALTTHRTRGHRSAKDSQGGLVSSANSCSDSM